MLDLIIGPSYEDVYSILGKFLKNLASFKHGRFIQTMKDDYLTTILLSPSVISDLGTSKEGSCPQKLDLDPTPARPSASTFQIIPQ
jgi:hypothetical protein